MVNANVPGRKGGLSSLAFLEDIEGAEEISAGATISWPTLERRYPANMSAGLLTLPPGG